MRAAIAVLSLFVLAMFLTRPLRPADVLGRWRHLTRTLRGEAVPERESAGFWFDPDYATFLADVRRLTPENSTVAVLVPSNPDLYLFQADYQLAPRRIVEERWKDEATFIATYRTETARGPCGVPIANGELWEK